MRASRFGSQKGPYDAHNENMNSSVIIFLQVLLGILLSSSQKPDQEYIFDIDNIWKVLKLSTCFYSCFGFSAVEGINGMPIWVRTQMGIF
jgi:hypothetical protein